MPSELLSDDSFRAALINQKHGYGFVCAAAYGQKGRVVIIEKVRSPYQGWTYRVKSVSRVSFLTLEEAVEYCQAKNVHFQLIADDAKCEFDKIQSGQDKEGKIV